MSGNLGVVDSDMACCMLRKINGLEYKQHKTIFLGKGIENDDWEMSAILSRPQYMGIGMQLSITEPSFVAAALPYEITASQMLAMIL